MQARETHSTSSAARKRLDADNDNLRAELKASNDNHRTDAAAIEELRHDIQALKAASH